jgi:ABC-type glycerol-3-phosphate transport system substrate-binding protein
MNKRVFWIVSLVALLSLLLAACGGQSAPAEEPAAEEAAPAQEEAAEEETMEEEAMEEEAAPAEESVTTEEEVMAEEGGTITIWSRYDLTDTENQNSVALNQRIEDFQNETGIEVIHEQIAWDQLSPKLALAVQSGGDVPDVVEAGSQHIPSLLDAGALMPMDDLLKDEPWVGELTDGDKLACVVNGERVCIAHNVRGSMMFYRNADFPDGFPQTNEEWLTEAARVKESGQYFTTFFAGRSYAAIELAWGPYIYSNGGRIFDDEGKPVWATEEVVEVVEFARALVNNEYIPAVTVTGEFSDAEAPWNNNETASLRGGSWSAMFVPGLRDSVDAGETGMTGGVSFNGGDPHVFMVSEGWVVPKGAQNPEGARAWLTGFMQPEFLAQWSESQFGIPTTEAAYQAGQFDSGFYSEVDRILGEQGRYMEQSPFYVESLDALAIAFQEMLLDPEIDAMERLTEAQEEVLNRYW